jgi:hypothetical protein
LLKEPESEEIRVDDVKLRAVIALLEVLFPQMDPENKAILIKWAADNFNERKLLFQSPLNLDYEALAAYEPQAPAMEEPGAPKPFADAQGQYSASIGRLPNRAKMSAIQKLLEALKE